ncbi:hypothetical protein AOLI_G00198520 [Acnodon oligacanthus]
MGEKIHTRASTCSDLTDKRLDTSTLLFVGDVPHKRYDLLVENATESDLGLYYCVLQETKVCRDTTDPCASLSQTTSTPPVSDCSVCWTLLVSVRPACVLLSSVASSTFVYCICTSSNEGVEMRVKPDDVTVHCGFKTAWARKSSHEAQPPLIHLTDDVMLSPYSLVWNSATITSDLLVTNATESDLVGCLNIKKNHYAARSTRKDLNTDFRFKTLTIVTHPAPVSEMERPRATHLITVMCVLLSMTSGTDVGMEVR